jgi:ubiquinone/menaquinone biosynthesis C-methylase UbiE
LSVIAVDQSDAMLEELKKRFGEIDCRLGNEDDLPIPSETVKHAFANMYLHHVENPPLAIKEMLRLVQPGSKVVITDFEEHPFEFLRIERFDRWLGFKREDIQQ